MAAGDGCTNVKRWAKTRVNLRYFRITLRPGEWLRFTYSLTIVLKQGKLVAESEVNLWDNKNH